MRSADKEKEEEERENKERSLNPFCCLRCHMRGKRSGSVRECSGIGVAWALGKLEVEKEGADYRAAGLEEKERSLC